MVAAPTPLFQSRLGEAGSRAWICTVGTGTRGQLPAALRGRTARQCCATALRGRTARQCCATVLRDRAARPC